NRRRRAGDRTMRALFRAHLVCVAVSAATALAGGFAAPSRAAPSAATVPASLPVLRSSIAQIAARLASDVGPAVKDALVVAAPLRSDEAAPPGPALLAKVDAAEPGAIGPGATA